MNTSVLRTAALLAGAETEVTLYDGLARLPHFNPDDDPDGGPVSAAVAELRAALYACKAVLFCTPEYAGALPGSFKNLLDWTVGGGETYGKPVAWINASSRLTADAGTAAHQSLRSVLTYTGTDIVDAACRRIVVPRSALDASGVIADPSICRQIEQVLDALVDTSGTQILTARPADDARDLFPAPCGWGRGRYLTRISHKPDRGTIVT